MPDSLRHHGLKHTRPLCPLLSPGVCPSSSTLNWQCHPIISSSVVHFSFCLQSFPASGSFPVSRLFASNGQSIGTSGEGNGTPLQYSCLENPMDGGAWWAAVHGVAKSRTWLSDFTFTFHFHALEKEMAAHPSVLAWRIPGMGEPGGLPSMGSHRVGNDWSDLALELQLQHQSFQWVFRVEFP